MSKEMMVIALGLWVIVVRTMLGIPGEWQTILFIATGVLLAVIGFLLRGEALGRTMGETLSRASARRSISGRAGYTFIENLPDRQTGAAPTSATHEHKEGITSLN